MFVGHKSHSYPKSGILSCNMPGLSLQGRIHTNSGQLYMLHVYGMRLGGQESIPRRLVSKCVEMVPDCGVPCNCMITTHDQWVCSSCSISTIVVLRSLRRLKPSVCTLLLFQAPVSRGTSYALQYGVGSPRSQRLCSPALPAILRPTTLRTSTLPFPRQSLCRTELSACLCCSRCWKRISYPTPVPYQSEDGTRR